MCLHIGVVAFYLHVSPVFLHTSRIHSHVCCAIQAAKNPS